MRQILALMRVQWLSQASYRANMVISVVGMIVSVVPVYFVARALNPFMAGRIQQEGGEYFAFVIVGMLVTGFLRNAIATLPGEVGSGINSGNLEMMLSTPTPLPVLLTGLSAYSIVWMALRSVLLVTAAWLFGATFVWDRLPVAILCIVLIFLAYLPVGLISSTLFLAFRLRLPIEQAAMLLSIFLGGVWYPTRVIPSWLREVSDVLPLTYGLRALRRTLLDGAPVSAVASDIAVISAFVAVSLTLGLLAFAWAVRYSRRSGTLGYF